MKKIIVAVVCLLVASVVYVGCSKKSDSGCVNVSVASEDAAMLTYINSNGITATKDPSGLYYQILTQGSGARPSLSSKVFVKYTGYFPGGTVFDQQQDYSKTGWVLGGLIPGWQIGIPLIQKGGKIRLIVPSSYGYGCNGAKDANGNVVIPSNAILVFDVELVDIQ